MASSTEILQELTELSHFLGEPGRDLAILGEGNTSARLDEDRFYVKASGQSLGIIKPEGFCAVRFDKILAYLDGPALSDTEVKEALLSCKAEGDAQTLPSVETFFHAYLLTLPNVNFVGHTHPIAVNSIMCSQNPDAALAGRLFPDEIVVCGPAPCLVDYVDPGVVLARHMKDRVEAYCDDYGMPPKVILMKNHGFIALGRSTREVQNITMMYVKTCRILLGTYALGGPNFMSQANVDRIHTRPDEHYRQRQLGQG